MRGLAIYEPACYSHEHRLWNCDAAIFAGADFSHRTETLLRLSIAVDNYTGLVEKQTEHSLTAQIEGLHCFLDGILFFRQNRKSTDHGLPRDPLLCCRVGRLRVGDCTNPQTYTYFVGRVR
jgi:hypothetical protein